MANKKPATDQEINHLKTRLRTYTLDSSIISPDEVWPLIARINQERTQVRKLKAALRVIAKAELYDPATGIIDADVLTICQQEARAALKEPANG